MNNVHTITGWRRWMFIGFGFGVGAVTTAAIILGGVAWYSSQPKPWTTDGIRATFAADLYNVDDDMNVTGIELEYVVENTTSRDYTLSPDQPFFLQDGEALRTSATGKYKISEPCFIPAANKVKCHISVPADFDTSLPLDGFAAFDNANRYKVVFPKPSRPTAEERKKVTADFEKMRRDQVTNAK